MENDKLKIIILHESLIKSLLADISTFGFLIATTWFNHIFIGNSKFVNCIILGMFILFSFQKSGTKKFYKKEDAIKYLNKA